MDTPKPEPVTLELKSCPFCGGAAEMRSWEWPYLRFQVRCTECLSAARGRRATEAEAIAAWNNGTRRAQGRSRRSPLRRKRGMTVVSSGWFVRHRQDFIRAHLQTFGQIRRSDIMGRFEVTAQTASADIARFVDMNPEAIIYDGRAKIYVLDKERAALSGEKGQP